MMQKKTDSAHNTLPMSNNPYQDIKDTIIAARTGSMDVNELADAITSGLYDWGDQVDVMVALCIAILERTGDYYKLEKK